ncbi:MAG: DUF3373 family protein [Bacteriovoracaceae bacterium]
MKLTFFLLSLCLSSLSFAVDTAEAQDPKENKLQELENRITDLELEKSFNLVKTSFELNTVAYQFNVRGTEASNYHGQNLFNLSKLHFQADIDPKLRAYFSVMNSSFANDKTFTYTSDSSHETNPGSKGSKIGVLKAYADYEFYPSFTFSFGRLPTTFGPPEHLYVGRARSGTYPMFAYSVPIDGLALTANLHEKLKLNFHFISRTIIAPFSMNSSDSPWTSESRNISGNKAAQNHKAFTQMLELEFKEKKNLWAQNLFILQYSYIQFASLPQIMAKGLASNTFKDDQATYLLSSNGGRLADFQAITAYNEIHNIFNTDFDLYAMYTHQIIKPNSNITANVYQDYSGDSNPYPSGTQIFSKKAFSDGDISANRFLVGTRYKFLETQHLGFEYLKATERSLPVSSFSSFAGNYYNLNGQTYHLYYNKKIMGDKFSIRLGYINTLESDRLNSIFYERTNARIEQFYTGFNLNI